MTLVAIVSSIVRDMGRRRSEEAVTYRYVRGVFCQRPQTYVERQYQKKPLCRFSRESCVYQILK